MAIMLLILGIYFHFEIKTWYAVNIKMDFNKKIMKSFADYNYICSTTYFSYRISKYNIYLNIC